MTTTESSTSELGNSIAVDSSIPPPSAPTQNALGPNTPDLGPGNPSAGNAAWDTGITRNYFTTQIIAILRLRFFATVVAVVVLSVLLYALVLMVHSFTRQIDKATPTVNLKELVASAQSSKEKDSAPPSSKPNLQAESAVKGHATPLAPQPAPAVEPVSVSTDIKVDISSVANSIVAVVSILVVAIAVLAISLLRTTYTLSVDGVRGKDSSKPAEVDSSLPLPGAELVKAIGEALATVIKGLPGKKD